MKVRGDATKFQKDLDAEDRQFNFLCDKEQYLEALRIVTHRSNSAYERYVQAGKRFFQLQQNNVPLAKRAKEYERLSRDLMDGYSGMNTTGVWALHMLACLIESQQVNQNKRWTDEEDEMLIEMACDDEVSMIDLALFFGRSPGAIQTRITNLVGVGRISQEISGRFVGSINGEHVAGVIEGELRKE